LTGAVSDARVIFKFLISLHQFRSGQYVEESTERRTSNVPSSDDSEARIDVANVQARFVETRIFRLPDGEQEFSETSRLVHDLGRDIKVDEDFADSGTKRASHSLRVSREVKRVSGKEWRRTSSIHATSQVLEREQSQLLDREEGRTKLLEKDSQASERVVQQC
jgi:hypothetical protein